MPESISASSPSAPPAQPRTSTSTCSVGSWAARSPSPTYQALVNQIASVLENAQDINPTFNYSLRQRRIFTDVVKRPFSCPAGIGFCTSRTIGQDFGDVFVMLAEGYNFDGIQNPGVARLGDPPFNVADDGILAAEFLRSARPRSEPAFDERDFHRGGTAISGGATSTASPTSMWRRQSCACLA